MIDQGLSGQRRLSLSCCGNEWGFNALQLWSWKLSYWWQELERGKEGEMKTNKRQMKWDERLLRDVSAVRSFVSSVRTCKTLKSILPSPHACDMRTAPTPLSLHFCLCLLFNLLVFKQGHTPNICEQRKVQLTLCTRQKTDTILLVVFSVMVYL